MENQHRKITGYRELTQDEINLMNEIKLIGADLERKIDEARTAIDQFEADGVKRGEAHRWCSIAKTHLQQGLMALTRAVARPDFF